MTTINAVGNGLSGATGTGNFVGATSPTLVTPTIGAATATSLTFSPTTGGIVGTTTNNNAGAGNVGEFVSSQILFGSAISISNDTPTNLTSISLTAGDWDVWGNVYYIGSANLSTLVNGINTTSATLPDASLENRLDAGAYTQIGMSAPQQRISLSSTTTVYMVARADYSSGSATICGGIYARRVR